MYPLVEVPIHQALPLGGLTKLCRVNDWAPKLNPYKWSLKEEDKIVSDATQIESLTPMMFKIRLWVLKHTDIHRAKLGVTKDHARRRKMMESHRNCTDSYGIHYS